MNEYLGPARASGYRVLMLAWLGGLLAMGTAQAQVAAPPLASADAPLVIRGVTVIDVDAGRPLPNQTVTITGNRIQRIEPAVQAKVPAGAKIVDGEGRYLIPGLWDVHNHPRQYVDIAYPLLVANGVTGIRDAGSQVPLATITQWKREIAAGTRVGPRVLAVGRNVRGYIGDSEKGIEIPQSGAPWDTYAIDVSPARAREVIDSLHAAGADMFNFYGMPPEMLFSVAAEVRRLGGRFGAGVDGPFGLELSDSGATFLEEQPWFPADDPCHIMSPAPSDTTDAPLCAAAIQRLRRNNTWVTAAGGGTYVKSIEDDRARRYTPTALRGSDTDAGSSGTAVGPQPASTADWMKNAGEQGQGGSQQAMIRAGMPLVVGTDFDMYPGEFGSVMPGFSVHEMLVRFVLAGMTPLAALQTATLNPIRALGMTDSLGTVAAGKVADLVLLDADPLADIWHTTRIRAVVANGRYYDRTQLDQLLASAETAARHP